MEGLSQLNSHNSDHLGLLHNILHRLVTLSDDKQ